MDLRPRPAVGAPCPGTEPAVLAFITAAVVAGLIVTGMAVLARAVPEHTGAAAGRRAQRIPPAAAGGPSSRQGLKLLAQAALACQAVPFQGIEALDWHGSEGQSMLVMNVWHAEGARPLARAALQPPGWPGLVHHIVPPGDTYGSQGMNGDGMLGMSRRLVGLLGANYRLAAAGLAQVAGRPAQVVTVRRPGGGLAARFWLDRSTHLPLRREMFGSGGRVVSDVGFTRLRFGPAAVTRLPSAAARPWVDTLAAPQLARLRGEGWPLPGPLPGNLALLGARETRTPAGPVIDLDYSDGLWLVSVFVQRGHLAPRLAGWVESPLHGQQVYTDDSDGHSVAWSARGFVYTVIGEAPQQTVAGVVAALPHDSPPGILGRLRHGLHRLVSWLG